MRGTSETTSNEIKNMDLSTLPLKTYCNRYNCYLLITDMYTCYGWIFPFADKKLPIDIVNDFLYKYSKKNGIIITDKGGELANSIDFRKIVRLNNYTLSSTAPESSF